MPFRPPSVPGPSAKPSEECGGSAWRRLYVRQFHSQAGLGRKCSQLWSEVGERPFRRLLQLLILATLGASGCIPRQESTLADAPPGHPGRSGEPATSAEQLLLPDPSQPRGFPNGMQNPALRQFLDNADVAPELALEDEKKARKQAKKQASKSGKKTKKGKKARKARRRAEKQHRIRIERRALPNLQTHESALRRLLLAEWGWRNDKDDQVHAPMMDWRNWKRIRIWTLDHLTAFKYTDDHHVLTTVHTVEAPGVEEPTSKQCMDVFEAKALPELNKRQVEHTGIAETRKQWRGKPVIVHVADGDARLFLKNYEFSLAWAAYPAYQGGCLVYAIVVVWDGEADLARRVRDRWVREGFRAMNTRTQTIPYRH